MSAEDAADLHRRAKAVFFELMDEPEGSVSARLQELCAGDERLFAEVSSLLGRGTPDTSQLMPEVEAPSGLMPSQLSEALMSKLAAELDPDASESHERKPRRRRFAEGDMFAERYRMDRLVGVGGMGEVWQAYDRMLDETVALKFVRSRSTSQAWVDRLLKETAIARRVSHPNVCRVHDAGSVDGEFFLSMEYVAGLDLSKALGRDGRLKPGPSRKLLVELVDALAAMHAGGLLHRDLKPANILLDESGTAHVSDFGLAMQSADVTASDAASGTRAYMAPEQQRGAVPSESSDVYALGLVLYEAVTNRRAFRTGEEILRAADAGELPPRPSVLVTKINALHEHIILRCLNPDPAVRPSAVELQVALSRNDPLEAVLSLGDVPTAEVIAGSRSRAPLRPAKARLMTLGILAALLFSFVVVRQQSVHSLPERSPHNEAHRARELLSDLEGVPLAQAPFEAFSYALHLPRYTRSGYELLNRASDNAADRHFWYRSAASPLSPVTAVSQLFFFGSVRPFDPPLGDPAASMVLFDRTGQLLFLDTRAPTHVDPSLRPGLTVDQLFVLAGLDLQAFEPCDPLPARAAQADAHLAWRGLESPTRVEVATSQERVVAFEVLEPGEEVVVYGSIAEFFLLLNALLIAALFVATLPRALRHFRSGRGDPTISMRVALTAALPLFVVWALRADYPAGYFEGFIFSVAGVFFCIASGFLLWILGIAIEPTLQRDWPRVLITWSRFFRGHVGGPSVRSDLLTGMCLGVLPLVPQHFIVGKDAAALFLPSTLLQGFQWSGWIGSCLDAVPSAILAAIEIAGTLVVLGWLLPSKRVAILCAGIIAILVGAGSMTSPGAVVHVAWVMCLVLFCLVRYGLLAAFALILTGRLLMVVPLSPSASSWYVQGSHASIVLVVLFLAWVAWPLLKEPRDTKTANP